MGGLLEKEALADYLFSLAVEVFKNGDGYL